jgi:hypothetical protein
MIIGNYAHKFNGFSIKYEIPHFASPLLCPGKVFIRNDSLFVLRGDISGDLPRRIATYIPITPIQIVIPSA